MFFTFPKSRYERVVCFEVENFEEVADADADTESRLEDALAAGGALVARLDYPSQTLCVDITDPTVSPGEILTIISSFGYKARPRKEVKQ